MPTRTLTATLIAALLASAGHAAVLVVDPGGPGFFADVQSAIDASQDGDVILVRAGHVYPPFVVDDRSLTLVADPQPGAPRADVEFPGDHGVVIRNIAAGDRVVLRGFEVAPAICGPGCPTPPDADGVRVESCQGVVLIEDCSFTGSDGFSQGGVVAFEGRDGGRIVDCFGVHLLRCELFGGDGVPLCQGLCDRSGGAGLTVLQSRANLYDTRAFGGVGGEDPLALLGPTVGGPGGDGVAATASVVFTSGSELRGGAGGDGNAFGAICLPGGNGGHGLHLVAGNPTTIQLATSLIGGPGGAGGTIGGSSCAPNGGFGSAVEVASGNEVPLGGQARHLEIDAVAREQQSITVEVGGQPGDQAWLMISAVAGASPQLGLKGTLLVDHPLVTIPVGSLVGTSTSLSVPIPSLGAGVESVVVLAQVAIVPLSGATSFLLGAGSATTLLDQQF